MTNSSQNKPDKARDLETERFKSLLGGHPGFVYLQAADHSIRYANDVFVKLFGEPEGRPCYEVIQNRKTPCDICPTFKVFDTNKQQEWEWKTPDGKTYQIYDYPFTDTDGALLVLELGLDITER
jgi:PAS domain-containing protein